MNPRFAAVAASGAIFLIGCLGLAVWAGAGYLGRGSSSPHPSPGHVPTGTLGLGPSLEDLLNGIPIQDPTGGAPSPNATKKPSPTPTPSPFTFVRQVFATVSPAVGQGGMTITVRFWDHANGTGPLNGACSDFNYSSTNQQYHGGVSCASGGNTLVFQAPAPHQNQPITVYGSATWPSTAAAVRLNHGVVASGSWTQMVNGGPPPPTATPSTSPSSSPPPSPPPSPTASPSATPTVCVTPVC